MIDEQDKLRLKQQMLLATGLATLLITLPGLLAASAAAQQITGTLGSPSATTTIDGKYLPNPPPKFGGEIGLDVAQSKPYCAAAGRSAERRTQHFVDHD